MAEHPLGKRTTRMIIGQGVAPAQFPRLCEKVRVYCRPLSLGGRGMLLQPRLSIVIQLAHRHRPLHHLSRFRVVLLQFVQVA